MLSTMTSSVSRLTVYGMRVKQAGEALYTLPNYSVHVVTGKKRKQYGLLNSEHEVWESFDSSLPRLVMTMEASQMALEKINKGEPLVGREKDEPRIPKLYQ